MAQQITQAIDRSVSDSAGINTKDVAITLDAGLNSNVYRLIRQWQACMNGRNQLHCNQVSLKAGRHDIAVTLMDSHTGALLVLASDTGTPYDPNRNPSSTYEEPNLNLTRHRIGSAIKPFVASATLRGFPDLYGLTLIDRRSDKTKIFGLPFSGEEGKTISAHNTEVSWADFLPYSDNLYSLTFSLLGLTDARNTQGLPRFERPTSATALRLDLTDDSSSLGMPQWATRDMFNPQVPIKPGGVARLELTPLASGLESLFNVRAVDPQTFSYDTSLWSSLREHGLLSNEEIFNLISPEITNFALRDVDNFPDLRSVLLGGEFNALSQYGRVGGAWSNVLLAESFARITTGRRIKARIIADASNKLSPTTEEWFEGARSATWYPSLMRSLEGVVVKRQATAEAELRGALITISGSPVEAVFDSGRRRFTVFAKTGTLDPDGDGDLREDSIFVFTAGIWNDASRTFDRPVTGVIYIGQGEERQAQLFADELLRLLDRNTRFTWSTDR
jgi:hypothetical protein